MCPLYFIDAFIFKVLWFDVLWTKWRLIPSQGRGGKVKSLANPCMSTSVFTYKKVQGLNRFFTLQAAVHCHSEINVHCI